MIAGVQAGQVAIDDNYSCCTYSFVHNVETNGETPRGSMDAYCSRVFDYLIISQEPCICNHNPKGCRESA